MVAFQEQPHGTGAGIWSVRRSCPCIAFHRPGLPGATSSSKTKQTAGSVHLQVCHCPNLQETLSWIRISWQQHHPEKFVGTKEPWQPRWKDKIAGFCVCVSYCKSISLFETVSWYKRIRTRWLWIFPLSMQSLNTESTCECHQSHT